MLRFSVLAALLAATPLLAQAAPPPLSKIKAGTHPRLILTEAEVARVKTLVESDPVAKQWYAALQERAKKAMDAPLPERKLVGPRLLGVSRQVKDRVLLLAGLYLLDGDRAKAERATREMLAAAAFADWNPSHFLDVAEMTFALAIGYDWLHGHLSPTDRETIRQAIRDKGLKPGLAGYAARNGRGEFWTTATHNWAQVCGGGLLVGALALADTDTKVAQEVYGRAVPTLVRPSRRFGPDGGWDEGPGYWGYATEYVAYAWSAAQSALGTDLGHKDIKGLDQAGAFWIHMIGPTGRSFNFADAGEGRAGLTPQMFWFARQFQRPEYARHEMERVGKNPSFLHLVWHPGSLTAEAKPLPLDAAFQGVDVACFRGAWDDPKATYVAFKGGDNRANHSHLDLGTFVLEAGGERWAVDLGGDNYNLPAYFGQKRWTYYRLQTIGQNTLTVEGANQAETAAARLIAFRSGKDRSYAVADLSAAYGAKTGSVRRGVALLQRQDVIIQDEFDTAAPTAWTWTMHTRAQAKLDGNTATLAQGGATLVVKVIEPADARMAFTPATQAPPQNENKGVSRLTVTTGKHRTHRLVIGFFPRGGSATPGIEPLSAWVEGSPLKSP